jgi:hypothetical protein
VSHLLSWSCRWAPLVAPVLYLAAVLLLQPPDRLGAPAWAPAAHQILFDDNDLAAYALRGLNARLGRHAGRLDPPLYLEPANFARALQQDRPLRPRYYLEYPHTALLLFRLGFLGAVPPAPAAVLDGDYVNLVTHQPEGERQRDLWRRLRWATRVHVCLMAGCLLALVALLRVGYEPGGHLGSTAALLALPAALYFGLMRFDVVPALLTALSLACLGRRWPAASGAALAAASLVKVYPVLLVPLVLRHLWPDRRATLAWLAGYGVTAALLLGPPLWREGWQAVAAPYRFQLGRAPESEPPTAYGTVLPAGLAANNLAGRAFRFGCLLLTLAAVLWRRPATLEDVLRRGAIVLIVFVSLAVFYSPQWVLWLAPLLLPLTARQRGLAWLVAGLDLVTYGTWPLAYSWPAGSPEALVLTLAYARFALLGAVVLLLLRAPAPACSPCPEGRA